MIPQIRNEFNKKFTEEAYKSFISDIQQSTGGLLDFKVCETPMFVDDELSSLLANAAEKILNELQTENFSRHSASAVPDNLRVPNENSHPVFLQIDFGITQTADNKYVPKVIELQGFPSLYAYQAFIDEKIRKHFWIPDKFTTYFSGLEKETYLQLMRNTLLHGEHHENVILLEIEPEKQKTVIDFALTQKYFGVRTICITDVLKRGNKLYYKNNGKEIPIKRIYNRVIFDELINKNIEYDFDFRDDLDVEWVGHPNWFFKISKHTLPFLNNEYSPKCYFLNELKNIPDDLNNYVLKPLYSFAGSGVVIDLTSEIINEIKDKENYILQEKVNYQPVIKTPEGYSKAEIRMMFLWDEKPILVNNLLRTSKGKMMGVDFNKNQTWIGSSIVYHQ